MYKHLFFMTLLAGSMTLTGCQNVSAPAAGCSQDSLANGNQVVETILKRRSIRKYKQQALSEHELNQIITCSIQAPNGMALESWQVRIVTRPELLQQLDSLYAGYTETTTGKRMAQAAYGAPAVAFIAYDKNYDLSQVDCGLLGGNMILSAQSMGIGSCCLGGICRFLQSPQGQPFMKQLDFPDTHQLLYAIALGYPDESPESKGRNPEKVKIID